MNSRVRTPPETVPGRELGPTSAQVARRERLAASRTSSQRVRIISASAASAPPGPPAAPTPPWAAGAAGALGTAGALVGPVPREDCSAGREERGAAAADGAETPGAAEAAEPAGPWDGTPSFGPSQLTAGPVRGACAADVDSAAGAEAAAGADADSGDAAPPGTPPGSLQPPAFELIPQPASDGEA